MLLKDAKNCFKKKSTYPKLFFRNLKNHNYIFYFNF